MVGPDRTRHTLGSSRHQSLAAQPPRPPNAWILYRSYRFAQMRQSNARLSQASVSKIISLMWKNEKLDVKRHFEQLAEDKKAEHQELFPDYRFNPQKKEAKMRARQERKDSRRAERSRVRGAVSADTRMDAPATADTPVPLPIPFMPQPFMVPGYQHNMALPQPHVLNYFPEAYYGSPGLSPPLSVAQSPAPCESPFETQSVASSSPSMLSTRPPSSQASSPPSQPYMNQLLPSHFINVYQALPDSYVPQPFSSLPFPSSAPHEPSPTLSHVHPPSTDNTARPAPPTCIGVPIRNGMVDLEIQTKQTPKISRSVSRTLADIDRHDDHSNTVTPQVATLPGGHVKVGTDFQTTTADRSGQSDFDLASFHRQMASFAANGTTFSAAPSVSAEDLQALLSPQTSPAVAASTTCDETSTLQDMMKFFNFEAAGAIEDDATVSPAPVHTAVAPQETAFESVQYATETPILGQMTNTPIATYGGTSYVPPGATYSSTRRVADPWKSSFVVAPPQEEYDCPWLPSGK